MSRFTDRQRAVLLAPIHTDRVQYLDGQSHLAAWDVAAHLNRLFGFEGWDKTILSLDLVYEHVGQREAKRRRQGQEVYEKVPACSVGYRCTMRLTIRNPQGETVRVIEDAAMGTATNQRDLGDAHDLAVKSAVSYALKRCAKDLGDQFGLSLYNKGQESACVQSVLPYLPEHGEHEVSVNVEADGIAEGDDGFGHRRGEAGGSEAAETMAGADNSDSTVREPAPARRKTEKPEATPPAPKPEAPQVEDEEVVLWRDTITGCRDAEDLRALWREIDARGALDVQIKVEDADGVRDTTLREHLVARVAEVKAEGAA